MFIYDAEVVKSAVAESETIKLGSVYTDADLESLRKQAQIDGMKIGTDCKKDMQGVPYYLVFGTPEHLLLSQSGRALAAK
jgi:hypothetical protein